MQLLLVQEKNGRGREKERGTRQTRLTQNRNLVDQTEERRKGRRNAHRTAGVTANKGQRRQENRENLDVQNAMESLKTLRTGTALRTHQRLGPSDRRSLGGSPVQEKRESRKP